MKNNTSGCVFNIQKFCTNDGPGIRTTVFLKGCPLDCLWCHNPESKDTKVEISYNRDKCTLCGACVEACERGAHKFGNGTHTLDRTDCIACTSCTKVCPSGALDAVGTQMTAVEAMREVLKDKPFYRGDGGMTVSGGEPFLQYDFLMELLKLARENGINTCVETSGFVSLGRMLSAVPYIDLFLYDYKMTDPEKHLKYTSVSNDLILKNLFAIDALGVKTILRCPIIPGINDDDKHFRGIAATADKLTNIVRIELMAYHPLGESKAQNTGKNYPMGKIEHVTDETVAIWLERLSSLTRAWAKRG